MKKVLLSHDSNVLLYLVPDEVAEHLEEYCMEFCTDWIWKNPNGAKLLKEINGLMCAIYGAPDFIEYLNEWRFPDQPSRLLKELRYDISELPESYQKKYPWFNF